MQCNKVNISAKNISRGTERGQSLSNQNHISLVNRLIRWVSYPGVILRPKVTVTSNEPVVTPGVSTQWVWGARPIVLAVTELGDGDDVRMVFL